MHLSKVENCCPLCDYVLVDDEDEVCDDCVKDLGEGILLICIDLPETVNILDPVKTGNRFLISEKFADSLFADDPAICLAVKNKRVTYFPETLAGVYDMHFSKTEDCYDISIERNYK